jgi:hypothetical protein
MFKKQEGRSSSSARSVIHKPLDGEGFAKYRIRMSLRDPRPRRDRSLSGRVRGRQPGHGLAQQGGEGLARGRLHGARRQDARPVQRGRAQEIPRRVVPAPRRDPGVFHRRERRTGQAKKLIEAARHWAEYTTTARRVKASEDDGADGEEDEDLSIFGLVGDDGDEEESEEEDERFEVWPENWGIVELFRACGTQWIMASVGMGGVYYQGLDYSRVRDVMEIHKVRDPKATLEDLRLMEMEAKVELNKKLASAQK